MKINLKLMTIAVLGSLCLTTYGFSEKTTLDIDQEEKALREQIRDAEKSGNVDQVKELRQQFNVMHEEHVKQIRKNRERLADVSARRDKLLGKPDTMTGPGGGGDEPHP